MVPEGQRPGDAHGRASARRQHQRVVREAAAGPQPDPPCRAADTLNARTVVSNPEVSGDRHQVKRVGSRVGECFQRRGRTVSKHGIRRDKGDSRCATRERTQPEHYFQGSETAA